MTSSRSTTSVKLGMEGNAALTLNLDPVNYPNDSITLKQSALAPQSFPFLHGV